MAKRRSSIPGVSFSAKRALGVTSAKRKVARATGIPTTRSGRRAKAGRMMGCATLILIVLLICMALVLGVSALAEESPEATVDPGLEALKAKLDQTASEQYAKLGAKQDSVNAFLEDETGSWPVLSAPLSHPGADVCAHYALMPSAYVCRTGDNSDDALGYNPGVYQYDSDGNLLSKEAKEYTPDEIWATFGRLLDYIKANSAAIIADGGLHNSFTPYVVIDVYPTVDTKYRAVYKMIEEEITMVPVSME